MGACRTSRQSGASAPTISRAPRRRKVILAPAPARETRCRLKAPPTAAPTPTTAAGTSCAGEAGPAIPQPVRSTHTATLLPTSTNVRAQRRSRPAGRAPERSMTEWYRSLVAQRKSIRLLSGGLQVRILPGERVSLRQSLPLFVHCAEPRTNGRRKDPGAPKP